MFIRLLLLLPVILINQWHQSYLGMVINIATIWCYLIITVEGPWDPKGSLFLLTVSLWGGCIYLWSSLRCLSYLGQSGWSILEAALVLYFLFFLRRAQDFSQIEVVYLLTAAANLVLQILISFYIPLYWGEYGCWSLVPLFTLPSYCNANLADAPVTPPPARHLVRVVTNPTYRSIDTPRRVTYYSDGWVDEEW